MKENIMNSSGQPVYQSVANDIKKMIVKGEINPSDILPSENTLAQSYNTSRVTIRKSLRILEQGGFIYSWPGKGYFVSEPEHDVFTLVFNEEGRAHDIAYKNVTVIIPDPEVQKALNFTAPNKAIKICRVIKQDKQPLAFDVKYLPYDKGTPIIETELNYAVFPEIAAAKSAPFAFYTKMEITAELPDDETANILRCEKKVPLLVVTRRFIDQSGKCIGYGKVSMLPSYGPLKAHSGYHHDKSAL
ncbi:GntR family transcriptional regulator [Desulfosarcina ovata]|nr:GntR family transcriptional regulator [Desulfosarcina ovata]